MTFKSGDTANHTAIGSLHIKFWREQKKFDFWLSFYKKLSLGEMSLFPSGHKRSEETRVLLKWCKYHSFLEILGTVIKLNDLIVSEETPYVLLRYFPFFSQHRHLALTSLTVSESKDRPWSNKTTTTESTLMQPLSAAVICWGCVSSPYYCVRGGFQLDCERKEVDYTVIPGKPTHKRNVAVASWSCP